MPLTDHRTRIWPSFPDILILVINEMMTWTGCKIGQFQNQKNDVIVDLPPQKFARWDCMLTVIHQPGEPCHHYKSMTFYFVSSLLHSRHPCPCKVTTSTDVEVFSSRHWTVYWTWRVWDYKPLGCIIQAIGDTFEETDLGQTDQKHKLGNGISRQGWPAPCNALFMHPFSGTQRGRGTTHLSLPCLTLNQCPIAV